MEGPLPRPAPADHQAHPGVQADALGRGVLARRREEQAAPARSTAPPGSPRRRSRSTCTASRRPSAATTASSAATSTSTPSPTRSAPAWPVFHPKGGVIKREMEDYVRRRHIEEGFEYVGTPHISKEGLFHTSGHLPYYADGMFPPMEMEGASYRLKAMNCPMHNLIFRSRGRSYRELPLRLFEFGARLPQREVRRRARADPGPRHDPGRLALLRHQGAGAGGDQAPARLLPRACSATSGSTTTTSSCPPATTPSRTSSSAPTRSGRRRPRSWRRWRPSPGSSWCPTRAARRTTARRSRCRRATRSAAPGRCRPSSTTSTSPTGFELEYQAADGTRQQPVMIHSAKFGSIERFIGVLVEHYAGAFPPWLAPVQVQGDPDRRAAQRLPLRGRRAAQGAGDPGRGRRVRRPDAEEDPQRAAAEGAVHADRRRQRRRGRRRSASATATGTRRTASPSRTPSPGSSRPCESRSQV